MPVMTRTILIDPAEGSAERLLCSKLTLDNLVIDHDTNAKPAIIGRVKVINLGYQKTVFARVTFDDWVTYRDYNAAYLESCEENELRYDIFAFGFLRNDGSSKDGKFVLSCIQDGVEYWDNNNEQNYRFHLNEEVVATENPDLFATNWQATENGEIIVEESDYPHFQPHPLTPTKLRFYSTIRNAPEKEIIPAKAKDVKHAYAYKDIAFECMLDLYEHQPEEEVVSVVRTSEECCLPSGEQDPLESSFVEIEQSLTSDTGDSMNPSVIQEDVIQATEVAKREFTEEDIFDKLEKEANQSKSDDATGSEVENGSNKVNDDISQCDASMQSNADGTMHQTEICPEQSCSKSAAEEPAQSKQSNDANSPQKNDEQSAKDVIENEGSPRRKKKSLFSKLCCGQAEHD